MKNLLLLVALSALAACAPAAKPVVMTAPIVDGCTIDVQIPVCADPRPRPYFPPGAAADDLAQAYEDVKGELKKSENCIDSINEAVSEWRAACRKEKTARVR